MNESHHDNGHLCSVVISIVKLFELFPSDYIFILRKFCLCFNFRTAEACFSQLYKHKFTFLCTLKSLDQLLP
jgi:hypothetical protein